MKVKVIYIGKEQAYIQHFCQILPDEIEKGLDITDNHVTASGIINLYYDKVPIIIFYEQNNVKIDSERIRFLRKKFTHLYILLVTTGLNKEEKINYSKSGVNDTISPEIKPEVFQEFFNWIDKYSVLLDHSHIKKREILKPFKTPKEKRVLDIVISSFSLLLLSPILLLTAIAIRIESKGPIIYKSKRVGSNYTIFDFWKFRSMYVDADKRLKEFAKLNQYQDSEEKNISDSSSQITEENASNQIFLISDDDVISEKEYIAHKRTEIENTFKKFEHDPRITKVGHFIRKYSIDELPQLINILKGDMSIVGNRPLPLYEAEALTADETIERFLAPAGLTGLWQVEKRGDTGRLSASERKKLDVYYARNYSIFMDLKIIFKTFTAFIQKEDV